MEKTKNITQLDIICDMIKPNLNGRKIVVLYYKENDRNLIKSGFLHNDISVDYWMDFSPKHSSFNQSDSSDKTLTLKDIEKHSKDFYAVIWRNFHSGDNTWFMNNGYKEIYDYIFLSPQKLTISGNISNYNDIYGNKITNLPANVNIYLNGYLNELDFGKNSQFAIGSSIVLDNKTCLKFGSNNKFDKVDINLGFESSLICGNDNQLHDIIGRFISRATMKIGDGNCWFGETKVIIEYGCAVEIKNKTLFADGVLLRTDGHALFDVRTGQKRNISANKVLINNVYDNNLLYKKIVIESHVWIGYHAAILVPSYIGSGCNVGMKALVKNKFPNNCCIAGMPAKIIHKDSAWAVNAICDDMVQGCGNSYALPTIELNKVNNEKLRELCRIENIYKYFENLNHIEKKLLLISIKDTGERYIDDDIKDFMLKMGLRANLKGSLQCAYIAVISDDTVIYEKLSETCNTPLEYESKIDQVSVKITSKPYKCGNDAEIFVNGFDYSAKYRGLNIVVYDKDSDQVVDSVAFDTHIKQLQCIRKLGTC